MARDETARRRGVRGLRVALAVAIGLAVLGTPPTHARNQGEPPESSWTLPLRVLDEALRMRNIREALQAWHEAYDAAFASGRWEGLIEVADAYLRIGTLSGARRAWEPRASDLYRVALFRANARGSLDGVLLAAAALAALGDRQVVQQSLVIATDLAASRDARLRASVSSWAERLTAGLRSNGAAGSDPGSHP